MNMLHEKKGWDERGDDRGRLIRHLVQMFRDSEPLEEKQKRREKRQAMKDKKLVEEAYRGRPFFTTEERERLHQLFTELNN